MITATMIPMIIVPLTFLFVLLIILIVKAPKAGACVIGGVLLVAPLFLWRLAAAGVFREEEAIPLVVVPITFLFVLLVVLLSKAPKVGAGLVVALVVMVVVGVLFTISLRHRHVATAPSDGEIRMWENGRQHIEVGSAVVNAESDSAFGESKQPPSAVAEVLGSSPVPSTPPAPLAPIWSEGIEQELQADVYVSKLAAVRALGLRVDRLIRALAVDPNSHGPIILFQHDQQRELIVDLRTSIQRTLPEAACTIEAELRSLRPGEIGITLQFPDTTMTLAPWGRSEQITVAGGRAEIDALTTERRATLHTRFVDKPWMENFAAFANARPDRHFLVARSQETCTSESEASQQALNDARARLMEALGRSDKAFPDLPKQTLTTRDVLDGGFIVDRFAQSFDGSAGKIWRHAVLLDASGSKLAQLAQWKAKEARSTRMSWARMGFSSIGVLVLIGAIYFFLNMATRGYYEWSLRIAGVVLAIVAVVSILMIVQ